MGLRINLTGYPGLDPAARTASGANANGRVKSSPPAISRPAAEQAEPQIVMNDIEPSIVELRKVSAEVQEAVQKALEEVNKYLDEAGSSLNFIYDEASDRSAVQVVAKSGEIIRQIPIQELLDAYAKARDVVGILLNQSG